MPRIASILLSILSIATGAIFLYSAYTKIDPVQPFEYTLVEYVHLGWLAAAITARALVGLEAGLGFLIATHLYGRGKWALRLSVALTIVFSIYLVILWITAGNKVNCGCFGDTIWMSPSASLIKNGVLLAALLALLRWHKGFNTIWPRRIAIAAMALAIALPFCIVTISPAQPAWLRKDRYHLNMAALYPADTVLTAYPNRPPFDLDKGKHVVAFLSQACPHCRIAARKMHLMKDADTTLPFLFIIGGTTSDLTDFWNHTHAQHIPWMRLPTHQFLQYTGGVFPMILYINNGWVEARADYNTMTQPRIEEWLHQP